MLLPISTYERQPIGIFPVQDTIAVEGGMIGKIQDGAVDQLGKAVIGLATNADVVNDASLGLLGIIDESSTGLKFAGAGNGVGNVGMLGALNPSYDVKQAVGPSTMFGSGKCTLWIAKGIFATDQYDTSITTATPTGTALYVGADSRLTAVDDGYGAGVVVAHVIKVITGGITSVDATELLGVLSRVQSLPSGTELLVFEFK